jgi:drug/metabolite transporter (DMT)-like permease
VINANQKAYLELSAAMAIAGSSVVVGKLLVDSFPVFLANALSLAISSVILLSLLFVQEKGIPAIGRQEGLVLLYQALTGVFLFRVLLFFGLKFTTALESGIITSTTPAIIGLISFFFLRERLNWKTSAGIGLAVSGILIISVLGTSLKAASGIDPLLGNLLVFGAVISEALFTVFAKATSKLTPLTTATSASVLGLLMFLPLALHEARSFDLGGVSLTGWLPIIYYGTVVSVLAWVVWFQGVSKVSASIAGVFSGVMPISAVLLSSVILREPFLWSHLIGVLCVLLAISLITIGSRQVKA